MNLKMKPLLWRWLRSCCPNSCLGEGRVESPNTRKVIALKTAQRGVCRDEGEHYAPAYIGMQQTQQVTDLVKGDGLDVESA